MIFCVVPEALADELFEKLTSYYAEDPNVTVIVDRREGAERRSEKAPPEIQEQRKTRDRRRSRVAGTFPEIEAPLSDD